MRVPAWTRTRAVEVCAIAALLPVAIRADYVAIADDLLGRESVPGRGHPDDVIRLAEAARARVRFATFGASPGLRGREVDAEAESLLRSGWSPRWPR